MAACCTAAVVVFVVFGVFVVLVRWWWFWLLADRLLVPIVVPPAGDELLLLLQLLLLLLLAEAELRWYNSDMMMMMIGARGFFEQVAFLIYFILGPVIGVRSGAGLTHVVPADEIRSWWKSTRRQPHHEWNLSFNPFLTPFNNNMVIPEIQSLALGETLLPLWRHGHDTSMPTFGTRRF
jgi:hypothetical protein